MSAKKEISKDLLYDLFVVQNLSREQVCEKLKIGKTLFSRLVKRYEIIKPFSLKRVLMDNTIQDRYGDVERYKRTINQKIEDTNLEKYGVRRPLQNSIIKEKQRETNIKRFGGNSPMSNERVALKQKNTVLERYGVNCVFSSPVVQDRIKQTNLKKYGVEYSFQNKDFLSKAHEAQRNLPPEEKEKKIALRAKAFEDKYGVKYPLQVPAFLQKAQITCRKKYGHDNPMQNAEVAKKTRDTILNKYGYRGIATAKMPERAKGVLLTKEGFVKYLEQQKSPIVIDIADDIGVHPTTVCRYLRKYGLREYINQYSSRGEKEIGDFLTKNGIAFVKTRDVISPYEIDVYCPGYEIGIEYNGNYWHDANVIGRGYHKNKSRMGMEKGVFIYHIFEYEWDDEQTQEKIKGQLLNLFHKNDRKVFARNCKIQEVPKNDKKVFLGNNHLQGNDKASVSLGLYYNEELVSVMTFCKPRFNKNYDWELSRFCNLRGVNVVGGASKLFRYFTENYQGSIISYSNIAKTRGDLYEKLGFTLIRETAPNYVWTNGKDVYSRYQTQMKNETCFMTNNHYIKICDCGNKVWEYKKK